MGDVTRNRAEIEASDSRDRAKPVRRHEAASAIGATYL